MAERPWHDRWLKDPWLEKDRESDFSRRNNLRPGDSVAVREAKTRSKLNTVGEALGIALGFGAALSWFSRIAASREADDLERRDFGRKQNEIWRHYEEMATKRGGGAFDNVRQTADGFWEQSPKQRAAGIPSARPLDRSEMNPWQQSRFDAAQDIRYTLESEREWRADPKGMAENARHRAEALGEPLDPRAARYFAERGLPAPGATGAGPVVASSPSGAGGGAVPNPNAVGAGPGVDIEGMKRAKPTPVAGFGGTGWLGRTARFANRAAGPVAALVAGWSLKEKIDRMDGSGRGGLTGELALGVGETAWEMVPVPTVTRRIVESAWRSVFGRGKAASNATGSAPASGVSSAAGPTEEEVRAQYSENAPDERAPSNVGGVPVDFVPTINPNAGQYSNAGGWGESTPRAKRGKPFKDPYGIGQGRLQAERDIAEQNEAEQREAKRQQRDERKADNYIAYIEREDRKNERARLARERRQIDFENDSDWLAQRKAWEEQRLERGGRRRHRSITVNSWQAAGAVVGGFSQINVELVRSEIERALEKGDAAIRMN